MSGPDGSRTGGGTIGTGPRAATALRVTQRSTQPGHDHVHGYGVMGIPLSSGDYLALRCWTTSSIGPAYRSVWHRDPDGRWTIYADQPPEVSCARFVGAAAHEVVTAPIRLDWSGDHHLDIEVADLRWEIDLVSSPATIALTGGGSLPPEPAWASPVVLRLMGRLAGPLLGTGPLRLMGVMPCGQTYRMAARRTWLVRDTRAEDAGHPLGHQCRPDAPITIGPVVLPLRGVFFADATGRFTVPAPRGTAQGRGTLRSR